jgi:N-acetylglucosaminyl-diphospho-decaprenol L-rhamnosyltransferase
VSSPDLAIVVVTWNVRDLTLDCLESVYADIERGGLRVQVWVADNASHDGTVQAIADRFPQARLIASPTNLGFAGGNNVALRAMGFREHGAATPYAVLLLNPDTLVQPGALSELLRALDGQPQAGIVGARLVYGDGGFQHSAFAFPGLAQLIIDLFPVSGRLREGHLNGRYPRRLYAGQQPFRVDHPLGAAMLVRGEAIRQVGLLDEGFHIYCEEIDWAWRMREAGWLAYCAPTAEIVHYAGQSTQQARPQMVVALWASRLRLYALHYGPLKNRLARLIIRAGMNRRIRAAARDSSQDEEMRRALIDACREVIRLTRQA